jgi:hypothetical protein
MIILLKSDTCSKKDKVIFLVFFNFIIINKNYFDFLIYLNNLKNLEK